MSGPFAPAPVTLRREGVRLEPLVEAHAGDLLRVGREESIWTYMPRGPLSDLDDARRWIAAMRERPATVSFAIIDETTARAVGSTSYLDIRPDHRGLEIGFTWLGADHQRTATNTIAKRLLLGHAFDDLGAHRVQFKTDARNEGSQRALERIGAVREGVLRRHMVVRNAFVRDSVFFGMIREEWPAVRDRLEALIRREERTPGRVLPHAGR